MDNKMFSNSIKKGLELAINLKSLGFIDESNDLLIKMLKEQSLDNKSLDNKDSYDLLSTFYGEKVYSNILDNKEKVLENSIIALYVLSYILDVINAINTMNKCWQIVENRIDKYKIFFEWLSTNNRIPKIDDSLILENFKNSIQFTTISNSNSLIDMIIQTVKKGYID